MSQFLQSAIFCTRLLLKNITKPQTIHRKIHRWVAPTLHELHKRRQVNPETPQPRSSFLEWNYEAEIFAFGNRIGEKFDKNILKQALTHKSYLNQQGEPTENRNFDDVPHNFELIKEGDAIISKYLNEEFGKIYESSDLIRAIIAYLSSDSMLAHVARHMGLTDIILTSEFPVEESTISDTFKAIVAALSHSVDQKQVEKLINDFLVVQLNGKEVFDIWSPENPFEYLNKLLNQVQIEPRLCNQSAINTILSNYQVGLYNEKDKKLLGIGWGESVEVAKNTAALDAIQRFYKIKN